MRVKTVIAVLAAAALWPAAGNAATLHGVVVGRQHGLLLVASPSGLVTAVRGHAAVGSRLVGTQVVGRATRVRIHGIVVRRIGTTLFLSSNRHLLAVHTGRRLAASPPAPALGPPTQSIAGPAPGTVVNTTVGVKPDGELDEESEDAVGQVGGAIQVQATVTAVGAGTVTLSVNGQTLTVNLPNGLTLPASTVGQTVTVNVSLDNAQGGDDQQGDDDGGGGGGDD